MKKPSEIKKELEKLLKKLSKTPTFKEQTAVATLKLELFEAKTKETRNKLREKIVKISFEEFLSIKKAE